METYNERKQKVMTVELISYTHNPIKTCAIAASMCYDSKPTLGIVKGCIESGHDSVLEHASFTFKICGVSRSFLAQMTRHRIASYSVQSQRFVHYDSLEWVLPTLPPSCIGVAQNACNSALNAYKEIQELTHSNDIARCVLPNATPTNMVVTMNLRSLINFCNLRLCNRASTEIRTVAYGMRECILDCPELNNDEKDIIKSILVPACESHSIAYCPESKGCGKYPTLEELVKGCVKSE